MAIEVRRDRVRGCGWREPGGLYLMAGGPSRPCGKLPIPLTTCPCCNAGIKPTRGWSWIDADALLAGVECHRPRFIVGCGLCPLAQKLGRVGLLWVGGSFYKTPADWTKEAVEQGISRRIPALPKGFKAGETWVLVAHREAIDLEDGKKGMGIFHAFKPTAVEYVVKGTETAEEIEALEKRGITAVTIERVEAQPELEPAGAV